MMFWKFIGVVLLIVVGCLCLETAGKPKFNDGRSVLLFLIGIVALCTGLYLTCTQIIGWNP